MTLEGGASKTHDNLYHKHSITRRADGSREAYSLHAVRSLAQLGNRPSTQDSAVCARTTVVTHGDDVQGKSARPPPQCIFKSWRNSVKTLCNLADTPVTQLQRANDSKLAPQKTGPETTSVQQYAIPSAGRVQLQQTSLYIGLSEGF